MRMNTSFVNKRAEFDYEILERFDAGILLSGHETKSIKTGHASLSGAHAIIRGGDVYMVGLEIPSFQPKNTPTSYDAARIRKLLLKKDEIKYLVGKLNSGLTLVPIKIYIKNGIVKIQLGLGKGRKKHDKREVIKKRETEKDIKRGVN